MVYSVFCQIGFHIRGRQAEGQTRLECFCLFLICYFIILLFLENDSWMLDYAVNNW